MLPWKACSLHFCELFTSTDFLLVTMSFVGQKCLICLGKGTSVVKMTGSYLCEVFKSKELVAAGCHTAVQTLAKGDSIVALSFVAC